MEKTKLMKKCTKCGRLNHIDEYVCEKCGSKLDIYSVPVNVTDEGEIIPIEQTSPYILPEPPQAQAAAQAQIKQTAPEKTQVQAQVKQEIPEKSQAPVRQPAPEKAQAQTEQTAQEKAKAPVRQPVTEKEPAPAKETAADKSLPETHSFGGLGLALVYIVIVAVLLSVFCICIKYNYETENINSNITAGKKDYGKKDHNEEIAVIVINGKEMAEVSNVETAREITDRILSEHSLSYIEDTSSIVEGPEIVGLEIMTKPGAEAITADDAYETLNKARKTELGYYVVQAGDTLARIAALYDITYEDLMEDNNLNGTSLTVGQKLIINIRKPCYDIRVVTQTVDRSSGSAVTVKTTYINGIVTETEKINGNS